LKLSPSFPPSVSYVPLIVVLAAVSAGITADRYAPISWGVWVGLGLGSLALWAVCWIWRRDRLAGLAILLAVACAAGCWHHLRWRFFNPRHIARYAACELQKTDPNPWKQTLPPSQTRPAFRSENRLPEEADLERIPEPDLDSAGDMGPMAFRLEPVALEAVVQTTPYPVPVSGSPPWQREKGLRLFRFYVEVCRIRDADQWRPATGRVLVRVSARRLEELTGQFGLGDRVRIFGQLGRIAPPANPGEYDFAASARGNRVLCTLSCPAAECIERLSAAIWYRPDRLLDAVRREGVRHFLEYIPRRPDSDSDSHIPQLAGTILLGLREELPPDYTEPFVRTGTVHFLSISGLHVGMVVLLVMEVMRLVGAGRSVEILAIAAVCVGYMVVSGARPPTVRATVLVELGCLAAWVSRRPLGWNTLAAAGLVILAWNPAELFRLGTQLSFLCVAVLLILFQKGRFGRPTSPKLAMETAASAPSWIHQFQKFLPWNRPVVEGQDSVWRRLGRWKDYFWTWVGPLDSADPLDRLILRTMSRPERLIRSFVRWAGFLFLSGAAIWAVVLPLIMAKMHLIPLSGLVLNVLAWPMMFVALGSGLVFVILGWIWAPVGCLLARICYGGLYLLEKLIRGAMDWPGSYFWTPGLATWQLVGFYGGLAAWLVYFRRRLRPRWAWLALSLWILLGWAAGPLFRWVQPAEPGKWECAFLSVGHGLAVVLHLPDGQTWLYDAGSIAAPDHTAQQIACYLWSRGVTRLDAVFLSHLDQDHYNALPELMERIPVDRVVMPSGMAVEIARLWKEHENRPTQNHDRPKTQEEPPTAERHFQTVRSIETDVSYDPPPAVRLYQAIRRSKTTLDTVHAPCQWQADPQIHVWIFHPPPEGVPANDNANSLVLGIEIAGRRVLLTGDLEPLGMYRLLKQAAWDCDLLLVPHHGSRKSEPTALARWCRPEWVVISGGRMLSTHAAEKQYHDAGAQVRHTGRDGAVLAELTPQQLHVRSQWYPEPVP